MKNQYKDYSKVFIAFSDETRLKVLDLLLSGEKCACVLVKELNVAQPALAYHMRILCESGIVKYRTYKKWKHYQLNPVGIEHLKKLIDRFTTLDAKQEPCNKDALCK